MKVLKWILIVVGGLLLVLVVAVGALAIYANVTFKQTQADRPLYQISADTSPEGIARGEYLMEGIMDCTEACHTPEDGPILSGYAEEISQGPIVATFAPSNITPDEATGIGAWSDAEIARAIREGVDKDGVGMVIMPSHNYLVLSDQDVAAVLGYLRNVEPVSNEVPPFDGNTVARIMVALGMFGPDPVQEPITAPQSAPTEGTVEYGQYLMKLGACSDCHGQDLAGGSMPMAEPDDAVPANLTPGGSLADWTEGDFIAAVYAGFGEGGRELSEDMPRYKMTEEDLRVIFEYLQTVPAVTK